MNKQILARAGAIAVLAVVAGAGYLFLQHTGRDRAIAAVATGQPVIPVGVAVAEKKNVPLYVRGIGTVQAYKMVTVKSRVDGQIMKVGFEEGQEVKAGDPLFQIDPRPFQAILDQASANRAQADAQLNSAQLDLDRYLKTSAMGYESIQLRDRQQSRVDALKSQIAADDAAIHAARLNLIYADIRAPFDGRTGTRMVDIGNLVQASQATSLVSITQIKPIYVNFTVPQDVSEEVRRRQAAGPLTVIAYTGKETELARGTLTVIDNQIETVTGTLRLKATFDNGDERLWPGQFVNIRLQLATQADAVTVPRHAVMEGSGGYFCFIVRADGTAERRSIEIGAVQDGAAIIERGVAAGEKVVVDGQFRLNDGARTRIIDTPASPGNEPAKPAPKG